MLTKTEKEVIRQCARKYHVSRILLFGSSLAEKTAGDLDLAVKGIKPEHFFDLYGDLFRQLSKMVDLVDLDSADAYFVKRILEKGKVLYES